METDSNLEELFTLAREPNPITHFQRICVEARLWNGKGDFPEYLFTFFLSHTMELCKLVHEQHMSGSNCSERWLEIVNTIREGILSGVSSISHGTVSLANVASQSNGLQADSKASQSNSVLKSDSSSSTPWCHRTKIASQKSVAHSEMGTRARSTTVGKRGPGRYKKVNLRG